MAASNKGCTNISHLVSAEIKIYPAKIFLNSNNTYIFCFVWQKGTTDRLQYLGSLFYTFTYKAEEQIEIFIEGNIKNCSR